MSRGLHTKDASTIKMLPSFVENLPSKDGNSTYVALDLGGTNFRVLLINIVDDNIDMDSQIYSVPQRNRSRKSLTVTVQAGSRLPKCSKMVIRAKMSKIAQK